MKRREINNKIILLLSVFLLFMLCVGAVSASPDADSIDDSGDLAVLKMVRDDAALSGAVDEDMVSGGDAADALSVNNDSDVLGSTGTYSGLASEIAAGGNVVLQHSLYTYDSGDTITISGANRVIDGNGAVIDMAGSNIQAFYVDDDGVTIKNLTIKNANYDRYGGAVSMGSFSVVSNCSFLNCSASEQGGAVFIRTFGSVVNCSFVDCSAYKYGGAVCSWGSFSVVSNCSFVNCSANDDDGGAVCMFESGSVVNCSFVNCSTTGSYGGAVFIGGFDSVVSNCSFVNCSANRHGGAVYIDDDGSVVSNCSFVNCSARYGGGAVSTFGSGSVVSNCSFVNNSGSYRNIYIRNGSLTLEDNKFLDTLTLNNYEFEYGSDFTVSGTVDAGVNVAIDNLTFKLNDTAVHTYTSDVGTDNKFSFAVGGTDLAPGNYNITATTEANNNEYTLTGSSIFTVKETRGDFNIIQGLIDAASENGVVDLTRNYTFTVGKDENLVDGILVYKNGLTIDGHGYTIDAKDKARIFTVTADNNVNLINITFKNGYCENSGSGGAVDLKRAPGSSVKACTFVNNYGGDKGALLVCSRNVSVEDCVFINNSAINGPALCIWYTTNITVKGSIFINNNATRYAGAILWSTGSDSEYGSFKDCVFINNTASGGGAILWDSGYGTVLDCNFTNNSASQDGGAIYGHSGVCVVNGCNFTDNSASQDGGAIYYNIPGNVTNCNFENNSGNYRNIYIRSGSLTLEDNKFLDTIITLNNYEFDYGSDFTVSGTVDAGVNVAIDDLTFKLNDTAVHTYTLDVGTDNKFSFAVGGTDLAPGNYNITATTDANNNEYTLTGSSIFTVKEAPGDFNIIQGLIDAASENSVVDLTRNYTFTVGKDENLVGGIVVDKAGLTIDGHGHSIDGLGLARIFQVIVDDVTLRNITLVNSIAATLIWYHYDAGAVYFSGSGSVANCNFINNTADTGGGVYFRGSGSVEYCNFTNNKLYDSYGTGIAVYMGSGSVTNCNFTNNTARIGNGAAVSLSGSGSVENCNFINNGGRLCGAVYMDGSGSVTNCNFTNNYGAHFGAVYMGSGSVENCNFINNTAGRLYGAVYFYSNGTVTNCNFTNNSGGAVYFYGNGTVTNCNFTNNTADSGGAVYMGGSGSVTNCNFINNTAGSGGAVYFYSNGTVTNCNFTNNSGDAVFLNGFGSVTNCNFINNTANDYMGPGAMYMGSGSVTNCNFINNVANDFSSGGGAVYFYGNGTVTNCNFTNNKAVGYHSSDGGAIYFYGNGTVTNCNFTNNYADHHGAAIFAKDSVLIQNSVFNNNSAGTSGAVVLGENLLNANIINCSFFGNSAPTEDGGAITAEGGSSNVVISDCLFDRNTAKNQAGAIWMSSVDSIIKNCTFTDNAASDGGAIYWEYRASGRVENCSFENNSAVRNGGAITAECGSGSVVNCSFVNNSGNYRNIYIYSGSLTLEDNKFLDTIIILDNYEFEYGSDFTVSGTVDAGVNVAIDDLTFKLNDTGVHTYILDVGSDQQFSFAVGGTELAAGTYNITATTDANNNEYTLTGSSIFTVKEAPGDFNIIQGLIDAASDYGVVDLTRNYTFTVGKDENLVGGIVVRNDGLTIDGHGYTIDALDLARVFDVYGSGVTIKNLTIKNANYDGDGYNGVGGAVYMSGSGSVVNCSFVNCSASGGGAVYMSGSGSVVNCSFVNCSASGGGAVYMFSSFPGSVVSNCSFVNCSASSGYGAVFMTSGSVVSNCSFVNCSTTTGSGGAVSMNDGSVVSNCSFVNCSARYTGGAVSMTSGSVVNCSFVNCSANGGYGGGAVYMRDYGSVVNCSFVNCSASGSGGAVYMRSVSGSVSGFVVSNCSFVNNSGKYRNIYIHRGSFTLEGNKFLDTTITLNNKNFNYGSDFTVTGTVDTGVNVAIDDLTFKLNDTGVHTYTSDVGTDNKFSFVVDGTDLAAGTYNITTSTDANNNEYTLTGSQIFTVNKAALPFTVGAVDTVTYPDDVSVTITAGVAGTFTVTIGTKSSDPISIAAGETKTIKVSGVSAGADQTVNVAGSPVDTVNYTTKTDSSRTVTVNQAGSSVNLVDVDDGVYNTPVVVTFNNLVNASGIADNVKIYDEVTKAEITGLDINVNNNAQTITVSGLAAGDYIINVNTVPENSNYHSDVGSGKIHVDKALLDMVVEIESSQVTYPDDVVVFISAPLAGDYKVSIGDKETTVHLTLNQYGRVVVSGLNANDNVYDVVVVGTPDNPNYDVMTNNSLSVKVNKAKLPMSVSVVSVIYPDDVIVTVNAPVAGTYNVTIGDKKNSVYVDVIGSVDFVISGLAARDNYDVVVVGTPDDLTNYDVMNNNTYVNVTRATLNMPVSVISPVTYPGDVVVNINAPVAGTYAIEINGKKNSTYVAVAGLISLSISGLAACDNYVVDVVGTPDDNVNYTSMSNSTTVTVDKATLSMQIDVVSPVFYPGDVVVNVTAPVDGNYSVTIDGVMKWALISKDQTESFTFANLLVRDQPYEISVEGTPDDDTNYTGMLDDTHTVRIVDKEWNPLPISVISPVTYPDVVVVTVSAPVDGYYNVTINGIVNGTHISAGDSKDIVISGLDANSDEYPVTVEGTPDSPQYAVLVNTTSVKVDQAGSIVNVIDVVDAVYGNTVVVSFTIPEDGNASGITDDVKIYNATNNVEIAGLIVVVNNAAKTISIDGLAAGDYIVNVTTAPINGNYASSVCSGSIHINKADLILPVSVISPVVYPGDVVVTVNAPVAGTYTVIVGSKMNSIHVDAGGPVDIHISGLDAKDSYGISVVGYADDSSYNPMANDTLTVKVYQAGSSVNIVDVLDGVYNAPVVVTFNNLVNASGIENVKIYNATDKSEIAGLTIDVDNIAGTITVTGLSNGNYIINATTIPENDNYYSVVASGSIHVGKAIMVMPVSAPSQVIYPEDVVVTVSAPVDGTYTVTINGISNSSYIAAGESVGILIRGLDARDAAYDIGVIGVPIDSSYEGMVNNTLSVNVIKLGDFNYIQYLINKAGENGVIELDRDYAFTPGLDDNMTEGIVINKKGLTINGNGYAIDGLGRARLFQVLESDVTLNDMDFVKGFAVNGGAIYWRGENGVVSESYFMGNNATAGGAIYWQGDAGYIKDSVFINNKANSDSLSAVQDNDLIFTFKGNENYINAIYTSRYDINFDNVTYWAGSVVNSDDVYPDKQSEEVGIYITVEIYDALNNMIHNETYVTDEFGKVSYDYSQLTPGNYIYKAYHEDDGYYSYIETNGGFSVNKYDIIVLGNQTVYVIKDASVTLQAIIDYKGTIDFTSVGLEFVLPNGTKIQASNVNNVWVADYVFTEIGNYTITAVTHGMDNYSYNTTFTGQVIVSDPILGDFQKLQKLIDDANDGDVIDLTQDYIYTTGLDDAIVDGVIVNKNNLIIDGHGYTIDALEKSRIFNVVGQGVIIRNITLVNGKTEDEGGAILWSGDEGNVSDSSFEANWANNGGAISWYGQNGAVSDCTFVDNIALISGGAILWSGDDGSVFGCSFEGSDAAAGGAIDWSGADGRVCDCSFVDNTVSDAGGAVEWLGHNGILSDCIFIDNSAIWEGGAICWHGWDGTVSGCSFDSNFANNYGGAVYWSDWADTGTLWNCSFINNNATLDGGAVYWYGYEGTLYNCSFTDNIAIWDGGAVYWGGSLGTVYDCYFDSNDAEDGGAIEWSGDKAKIYDCSFVDNTASWTGGALHWASYNGVLSNCSFEYNTATLAGGAIYCVIDSGMVSNSTFNNNDGADYRNIYLKVEGMEIIENKFLDTTITLDEADYVYGDDLIVSGVIDAGVNYEIDSLKLILNDTLGSEFTSNVGIDRRFSFTVAGGILAAGTYNVAATNDLYDNEYALTSCETFVVNKAGSSVIVIDVTDGVYSYPVDVSFTIPSNGNATGVETTGVRVYNATNNEEITGLTIVVNNNDRIIKIINLAAGDYIVNVTTAPINGNYASSICSGKVHVDKANLTLSARVTSPVTYPSDVVVTVMAPIAGTYTVTINGISNSVHIDAGGFLDIGISGLIPSDDAYPISVVGVPDDSSNYENMACDDLTVKVDSKKIDPDVNVIAEYIGDGNVNVAVDVPSDFTGDIAVIVGDTEYLVVGGSTVVPGVPGDEIIVKLTDDPIYKDKNVSVTVPKADLEDVNVTVSDNGDGTFNITVDVPDDFTGDITVVVNGTEYPVDNGTATVPITPGSDFIVEFSDDPIYNDKNVTVVVAKKDLVDVNVTVSDNGDGTFTIGVDVPDDFTGDVTVNVEGVEYPVSDGTAVIPAVVGEEIIVEFSDDPIYNDKTIPIVIKKELPDGDVNVTFIDNGNGTMNVTVDVPDDFTGNITIIVNGTEYPVTNGTAVIPVNPGDEIIVDFGDDPIYANKNITVVVKPKLVNGTVVIWDITRGVASPYDAVANFTDEYGKPLVNTRVEFIVDGVTYYTVTDEKGTAYLGSQLPLVNDTETKYNITAVNPSTGENMTAVSTIVPRFIVCSGDLSADYLENPSYVVQVIGDDANPVGAGEIVRFVFAGFYYDIPTNETGHAVRPIGLAPGMYAVYATYKGQRTEQTVFMVYQTLKAYSGTIVKTAKSYTLKATLIHTNGTPLVGKEVTLQLNNKKYIVKTNNKGVASYTIKSSVIKKLKAGTVYNLTARYVNDLTKGKSVGKIVVVSHAISAKKTTVVKKSAKSASVKITLNDGSVLKNKKLSIKFNGKTYSAKTNNKGIAYFKLNSNVLKTLGKGKTYSYVITYSYDKLTRYIKVQ